MDLNPQCTWGPVARPRLEVDPLLPVNELRTGVCVCVCLGRCLMTTVEGFEGQEIKEQPCSD